MRRGRLLFEVFKISVSFYDRKAGEWRAEQDRRAEAMLDHRRADRSCSDTGIELLELATAAHDTLMSQESDERRHQAAHGTARPGPRGGPRGEAASLRGRRRGVSPSS